MIVSIGLSLARSGSQSRIMPRTAEGESNAVPISDRELVNGIPTGVWAWLSTTVRGAPGRGAAAQPERSRQHGRRRPISYRRRTECNPFDSV